MGILYFDCSSGISGDMTLAALLELGVPFDHLIKELKKLELGDWQIAQKRVDKNGINANYIVVEDCNNYAHSHSEDETHTHEHHNSHTHEHNHNHEELHAHKHSHRNYSDIKSIINNSDLCNNTKELTFKIFDKIAYAEAKVHGKSVEEVGFHEVGALDSIIDIVGCAICIDYLKPEKIIFSRLLTGSGFVNCQHGLIPIPAPATLEIFAGSSIPFSQGDVVGELTTPTGAAIAAALAEEFSLMDNLVVDKIGIGAGTKDLEIPNILRVMNCTISGFSKKK